jgi:polyisoprenyl-phosphate glycosyltransferase
MPGEVVGRHGGNGSQATAQPGLSIVVPLFNEANNLSTLHARLVEVARRLKDTRGLATEVVYVDDGSSDATLATRRSMFR